MSARYESRVTRIDATKTGMTRFTFHTIDDGSIQGRLPKNCTDISWGSTSTAQQSKPNQKAGEHAFRRVPRPFSSEKLLFQTALGAAHSAGRWLPISDALPVLAESLGLSDYGTVLRIELLLRAFLEPLFSPPPFSSPDAPFLLVCCTFDNSMP